MARRLAPIIFVLTIALFASKAQAQFGWARSFCDSVCTDFKRNNCFPDPFLGPDRLAVRAPFNVMVQNGWQLQNTLTNYHFDEMSGELTEAARTKLRWILTQAPKQHRNIYLHRAEDPAIDAQRLRSIQAFAGDFVPAGTLAQVELTDRAPAGWPAERVNAVDRAFYSSAPEPRLPAATVSSGGESGS